MISFAKIYQSKEDIRYFRPFGYLREKLGTEKVLVDGRSLNQSVVVIDDPKNRFKGLCGDDFALENQLAAGVNLKPCMFQPSLRSAEAVLMESLRNIESQKLNNNGNEN